MGIYTKSSHKFPLLILAWPWTRYSRQICTHCLALHPIKVLPDSTDLAIYLRGVGRVAVLEREAVGVVHELFAVGDVVLEETFFYWSVKGYFFPLDIVNLEGKILEYLERLTSKTNPRPQRVWVSSAGSQ